MNREQFVDELCDIVRTLSPSKEEIKEFKKLCGKDYSKAIVAFIKVPIVFKLLNRIMAPEDTELVNLYQLCYNPYMADGYYALRNIYLEHRAKDLAEKNPAVADYLRIEYDYAVFLGEGDLRDSKKLETYHRERPHYQEAAMDFLRQCENETYAADNAEALRALLTGCIMLGAEMSFEPEFYAIVMRNKDKWQRLFKN